MSRAKQWWWWMMEMKLVEEEVVVGGMEVEVEVHLLEVDVVERGGCGGDGKAWLDGGNGDATTTTTTK